MVFSSLWVKSPVLFSEVALYPEECRLDGQRKTVRQAL